MASSASSSSRVFGLDVVRSIAIVLVMVCHARWLIPGVDPQQTPQWWLLGHAGVDLFFVLSGYLIGRILLREIGHDARLADVRRFWIRRWFRTLPNYLLAIVLACIVAWDYGYLTGTKVVTHLFFVRNLMWNWPTLFPVGWSLAVEEWFYLTAPLLLLGWAWMCRKRGRPFDVWGVIGVMLGVPLAARLWFLLPGGEVLSLTRAIVGCRLDAIGYGVLLARLMQQPRISVWLTRHRIALAGAGLLVWAAATLALGDESTAKPAGFVLLLSLAPLGAACLLPWAMAQRAPRCTTLGRVVTFISVTSYSLYLYHWFVRFALLRLSERRMPWLRDEAWGVAVSLAVYVVASVVIAALAYRYYERPMTALRDRFSQRAAPRTGSQTARAPRRLAAVLKARVALSDTP